MLIENLNFKQNRELSWLKFNERILEEADDTSIPTLERLKFVSIYAANLDEFFMIRVGSLYDKSIYTPMALDTKSGQTPGEQLQNIYDKVRSLNVKYNNSYKNVIEILKTNDIYALEYDELENSEKKFIKNYFNETIYSILSPQIVDPHHPFPHLKNKAVYIACLLKNKEKTIFGIVPVPEILPTVVFLPGQANRYIHIEKIILEFVNKVFGKYDINEKVCVAVTRNADITSEDDTAREDQDFRIQMKKLLHLRKKLAIVRLETSNHLSTYFSKYLCEKLDISDSQVYTMSTPLKMNYVFSLINTVTENSNKNLVYPPFVPVNTLDLHNTNMMQLASKKDLLFHYPYVSMKPFLYLLRQAAYDPNVISIRITLYRVAMKATLIDYLCSAAENGKDVTVLIELRARFDEQNNIDWSEKLEDAGCKVIYGFEDYKVHSKVCLITYRDKGKTRFITQIGTGNYNEKTAELYADLSLITGNEEIGLDATEFFKNMSIGNHEGNYKHLLVAPNFMKPRLLEMMDEEIKKGRDGRIFFKLNSITDIDIINKLSEASNAGVNVSMVIRSICCVLPGIGGKTENIRIRSIVGRFLEHHRIYIFGTGESQKMYISSADMMTRNLDCRVEVACPIYDADIKKEINEIIETLLYDNVKARTIDSQGDYNRIEDNKIPINSQELFIKQALQREVKKATRRKSLMNRIKELFKAT
ncbi:polyphosphate kinase 1 [Tissierella creatinini]|nr:polyphosphate kinase 1 [Tissierella creatinini]TJX62379.1 polyphosphate kinase 1 [Soehngenia saccharolytica]